MTIPVTGMPDKHADKWQEHRKWESEGESPVPVREVNRNVGSDTRDGQVDARNAVNGSER